MWTASSESDADAHVDVEHAAFAVAAQSLARAEQRAVDQVVVEDARFGVPVAVLNGDELQRYGHGRAGREDTDVAIRLGAHGAAKRGPALAPVALGADGDVRGKRERDRHVAD